MKSKKKIAVAMFVVALGISFGFVNVRNVSAFTEKEVQKSIMDKAVFQGVYHCYTGGYVKSQFGSLSDYSGIGSLLSGKQETGNPIPLVSGADTGSIWAKAAGYNIKDGGLTCSELFKGGFYLFGGSNSNLLKAMGKSEPEPTNADSVEKFFEGMGYYLNKNNDFCYNVSVTASTYGSILKQSTTNAVCKKSDGTLYADDLPVGAVVGGFTVKNNNQICLAYTNGAAVALGDRGCTTVDIASFNANTLNSVIRNGIGCNGTLKCTSEDGSYTFDFSNAVASPASSLYSTSARFLGNNGSTAAMQAIRYLSEDNSYQNSNNLKLTDLEKRVLYQGYLTDYYGVAVNCNGANIGTAIRWYDVNSNTMKTCYYDKNSANSKSERWVNGVSSSGYFTWASIGNLDALLTEIGKLKNTYSAQEVDTFIGTVTITNNRETNNFTEGQANGEKTEVTKAAEGQCTKGAGVVGWILCPILNGVASLGNTAYEWIEDNFMQIRASMFSDSNTGVYDAWRSLQNVANIAFVILFLVVIFSQLTGIGIDNYGIKRILPKLIVTAILVNLSYIICELVIDVSNIVGNGLRDIFTDLAPAASSGSGYDVSMGQGIVSFGGGAAALAAGLILSNGVLGTLLLLLGALVACVIAIVTLLVILVIRQAGVVICVIIAPVAMVCYLLPNTEKFFKKWLDLMKGLLIVYPICGLLVGGGAFVSRVFANLASSESGALQMGFALSAMLVEVLPFFLIPTLLKTSLAAMGNLGARISNLGRGVSGRANKAIQSSDAMKMSRQRANDSRMMRRAGYSEKTGGLTSVGKAKARFARSGVGRALGFSRMQNAYVQSAEKIAEANKEANASLGSEITAADFAEYKKNNPNATMKDFFQEQVDRAGGDIRQLDSVIMTAEKRGMKKKDIASMLRTAENNGTLRFNNEQSRANWMNNMLQKHGDIVSTDYEMQEWMRNGGSGPLGDYGDYAKNKPINVDEFAQEDVLKMSGDSLAGMIAAGVIDQTMAQRVMAMNPNISADKKVMLGAVASGSTIVRNPDGTTTNLVTSAKQFKIDAETLARNHQATQVRENDGSYRAITSIKGLSSDKIDAWTSASPQDVNVVQNFTGGGRQYESVRAVLDAMPQPIVGANQGQPDYDALMDAWDVPTEGTSASTPAPRSVGNEVRRDENAEATRRLEQAAAERRQRIAEAQRNRGGITLPGEQPDGQA